MQEENVGTDNKSQRANGRNVADLKMKLGMLQLTEGWRHWGSNYRADAGRDARSRSEFTCDFYEKQ